MPQVDTKEVEGVLMAHVVKSGTKVSFGEIGCLNEDGVLVVGSVSNKLKAVGRIETSVTGNGIEKATVKKGTFLFKNDASAPVTETDLESDCFISGSDSVALSDAEGTLSKAGIALYLDGDFVAVKFI